LLGLHAVSPVKEGSLAPAFDVAAHDGSRVALADHAGRYVLVWFFPEADTPHCTIEGNGFRDRFRDFEARNVTVFGASFDAPDKNRAFAEKFGFPFKLLTFDKAADVFGVEDPADPGWPKRISFLIGPDGRIVKIFDPVDHTTHPAQVLAEL